MLVNINIASIYEIALSSDPGMPAVLDELTSGAEPKPTCTVRLPGLPSIPCALTPK